MAPQLGGMTKWPINLVVHTTQPQPANDFWRQMVGHHQEVYDSGMDMKGVFDLILPVIRRLAGTRGDSDRHSEGLKARHSPGTSVIRFPGSKGSGFVWVIEACILCLL